MTRKKIMVIDDDEIFNLIIQRNIGYIEKFEMLGVYTLAEDALQRLENFKNEQEKLPDVILLDINMPIMDGWQFLEALHNLVPHLVKVPQIYMATSSISMSDRQKSSQYELVHGFLVKPILLETLQRIA